MHFHEPADLKRLLERELHEPVPDALWGYLCDGRYVDEYEQDGNLEAVVEGARQFLRWAGQLTRHSRLNLTRLSTRLGMALQLQADAVSVLLAEQAESEPRVRIARHTLLGSTAPLAASQARALLKSPAAQLVTLKQFRGGFPLQHMARLTHDQTGDGSVNDVVEVSTGDRILRIRARTPTHVLGYATADDHHLGKEEPEVIRVDVAPGSWLDTLRTEAAHLTGVYPWDAEDAARFILEGVPPPTNVVQVNWRQPSPSGWPSTAPPRARITLSVEAWVPPENVARAYREVQRELLVHRPRLLSHKSLALTLFVVGRRTREPGGSTWKEHMQEWNTQNPNDWSFRDYRHFRQAYVRAVHTLLRSEFRRD